MFFLLFLLDDRRIRIRIHISDQWIRIREAQKHMDPTDQDPQHCPPPPHPRSGNGLPETAADRWAAPLGGGGLRSPHRHRGVQHFSYTIFVHEGWIRDLPKTQFSEPDLYLVPGFCCLLIKRFGGCCHTFYRFFIFIRSAWEWFHWTALCKFKRTFYKNLCKGGSHGALVDFFNG